MLDFGARRGLPTVLLIDDDLVSREVTATLLTMSGYTVHAATGGESSLELLDAGEIKPDLILMDAQMPGLSGTRLIEELRLRSRSRLIAISGSDPPVEVVAAADGFLLKPFAVEALEELLKELDVRAIANASAKVPGSPATVSPARKKSFLDPDQPVVSVETLAQFRGLMPESAVREIYAAIVADLAQRLAALEAAIANDDGDEIRRIGHSIKGGCGMAGALEAARLGAKLEETVLGPEGNQLDNSTRLLGDLRNAARNLERMLEGELPA